MSLPIHLGIEHPNLVWLGIVAFLAFVAGLGVNLYRTHAYEPYHKSSSSDEQVK